MLGAVLVMVLGVVLMTAGLVMLCGWVSGRGGRFARAVLDRAGDSKNDRQFLSLYFVAFVVAPLLSGAILIAFGLQRLC